MPTKYMYVVGKNGNLSVYIRQDCFVAVAFGVQVLPKVLRLLKCICICLTFFCDSMGQLH